MKNKIIALTLSLLSSLTACNMYPAVSAEREVSIPSVYDAEDNKIFVGITLPAGRNTFFTAHIHECNIDIWGAGTLDRSANTMTYYIPKNEFKRMFTEDSRYTSCRVFEQTMTVSYTVTYVHPRPFEGPLAAVTYRENFRLVP